MSHKSRTFSAITIGDSQVNIFEFNVWGTVDIWKCISKTWSEHEDFMESTYAMEIQNLGVMVRTISQQGDHVSEALIFIEKAHIFEVEEMGEVVSRSIVKN